MSIVKLSVWAKENGYTLRGARNRFYNNRIPGAFKTDTGRIMIRNEIFDAREECVVIYARVSSHKQKDDLERQVKRLCDFCVARGWQISKIYKEIASGMNDSRPKLQTILRDEDITKVVVEHKDRLTRFGFNYIDELADFEIVVANPATEENEDLMQDMISVITSMVARYYGKRRSQNVADCIEKTLHD